MELKRIVFVLWMLFASITNGHLTQEDVYDLQDLCRYNRNIDDRHMEENDSYQLNINSTARSDGNDKLMLRKFKNKCQLRFKVCSSCHFSILIRNMHIPDCSKDCSCNHFEIQEPLSSYVSKKYCGEFSNDVMYYESKTRVVFFDIMQSVHKPFYVSLTFNVSSNVYIFTEDAISHSKFIETPHFPSNYPPDYSAEYHFRAMRPNSRVQLLFIDFQLSRWSYIEVSGHNGTHAEMFYGDKFRPPVLISDGPVLRLKFVGNDLKLPNRGFRAKYTFVKMINGKVTRKPNTNCGGREQTTFGLFDLTPSLQQKEEMFDCIWLILPSVPWQQSHFFSASVLEFKNMGPGSTLEFREGLTSKSALKGIHRCSNDSVCGTEVVNDEVTADAKLGLFIRFRGIVKSKFALAIVYHTFKLNNCSSGDFLCGDGRCLSNDFVCDGHSHCLNGSDEVNCTNTDAPGQTKSSTLLDTFTFFSSPDFPNVIKSPKMKRVSLDGSSGILAAVVIGSCGIVTVLLLVGIIIYNQWKRRDQPFSGSVHGENIAVVNFNESSQLPNRNRRPTLCLPVRDHPPPYEHVITFNDRYPPLFYTRPAYNVEIHNESASSDLPKFDDSKKNLLCSSDPNASFHELPYLSNDSFVISLNCASNTNRHHSFDVTLVTRQLTRSLSLDLAIDKSMQSISNCVCHFSFLKAKRGLCRLCRPLSRSAPSNRLLISNPALGEINSCFRSDLAVESDQDSLLNPAAFSSDSISGRKNEFESLLRKKTYSF